MYKTIFDVSELDNVNKAINSAAILLEFESDCDIRLILRGNAVLFGSISKDTYRNKEILDKALKSGLKIVMCNVARMANNIKEDDLFDYINVTKSATWYMIMKQSEGYSYIRM